MNSSTILLDIIQESDKTPLVMRLLSHIENLEEKHETIYQAMEVLTTDIFDTLDDFLDYLEPIELTSKHYLELMTETALIGNGFDKEVLDGQYGIFRLERSPCFPTSSMLEYK